MKLRWFIAIVLIVSPSGLIQAQQEPDRIIAGEHLVRLWDAIKLGKVKIDSAELKDLILKRHLSAILIPQEQPADKRVLKKCYKVKTVFDIPDMNVSVDDYTQLIKYAKDGVFEQTALIRDAITNNDPQQLESATAGLTAYLNTQAGTEKEASQMFAGALLADLEPTKPELASLVTDFRTYVEKDTVRRLPFAGSISPRTPYTVGVSPFGTADLMKINPATVKQLIVGGKSYRVTWVGGTYLLTLQDTSPTPRDPTGLGLSEGWVLAAGSANAGSVKFAMKFSF